VSGEPRKHVIKAFYPAGFTENDSPAGSLHVFNYFSGRQ
jgi:hypothetical protein